MTTSPIVGVTAIKADYRDHLAWSKIPLFVKIAFFWIFYYDEDPIDRFQSAFRN